MRDYFALSQLIPYEDLRVPGYSIQVLRYAEMFTHYFFAALVNLRWDGTGLLLGELTMRKIEKSGKNVGTGPAITDVRFLGVFNI
jgi:hypothetical protein